MGGSAAVIRAASWRQDTSWEEVEEWWVWWIVWWVSVEPADVVRAGRERGKTLRAAEGAWVGVGV